ncbi:hypothetical protein ACFLYU_01340 [Candidatus Dependentiae bacterium]
MKPNMRNILMIAVLLSILPGCGKIYDWGKDNFYQGQEVENNMEVARSYIKSKRVYNQFTIVGQFDALWLSDEARKNYANIYCCRHGKTQEQAHVFLRRQLEENNHFVAFYVLSLSDIILGDKDSVWSVSLEVGDGSFKPVKIKTIELSPEYIDIFGKKYNKFKDVYLIYFNAKDVEDKYIISDTTDPITLLFRSVDKEVELVWNLRPCLALNR